MRQRTAERVHPHTALPHPYHAGTVVTDNHHGLMTDGGAGTQHEHTYIGGRQPYSPGISGDRYGIVLAGYNAVLEISERKPILGPHQIAQLRRGTAGNLSSPGRTFGLVPSHRIGATVNNPQPKLLALPMPCLRQR